VLLCFVVGLKMSASRSAAKKNGASTSDASSTGLIASSTGLIDMTSPENFALVDKWIRDDLKKEDDAKKVEKEEEKQELRIAVGNKEKAFAPYSAEVFD
jgi:predicted chitinase